MPSAGFVPSHRWLFPAAVAAAVAAALVVSLAAPAQPLAVAVLIVLAAASLGLARFLGAACAPGRLDLFAPHVAFPLFYLAWLGLSSIPLLRDLDPPRALTPPLTQWPIYALGLAAYFAGVWLADRALGRTSAMADLEISMRLDPRRLLLVCLALFLSAASVTAAIYSRNGVPLFASSVEAKRLQLISSGYERILFMGFATTAILILAHVARERFRVGFRFYAILGITLAVLATTADRGLVVLPVAIGVILAHYLWRPLSPRHLAAALVALGLFATAAILYRGINTYGSQYLSEMCRITRLPQGFLPFIPIYLGVWAGPNVFFRLQEIVPSQLPYGHGEYAASSILSFLPGHQEWAPEAIKRMLDDRFIGLGEPATLLGSFYLDFGHVGLVIGMALAGFAMTALYRRLRARRDVFTAILYAHLSFLMFLSLYGDLYHGNTLFIWNGALCWIACRFSTARAKGPGA